MTPHRPTRHQVRLSAAALVLALVAPVLPLVAADQAAAESALPSPAASAQARAAQTGERVEVVTERTEHSTTFANPDGESFTLEQSIVPVRVATGDGGWADPDPALVKRSDGSVGPKASTADFSFSGGGDGSELVEIDSDGRSLSLGWPGVLPKPVVDGSRAIYKDVLPGVNLVMTAGVEGFRQVLEVTTPEAAANPALTEISYGLKAEGLKVREGVGGGLQAVDGNGNTVFRSPAARMWNSAGESDPAGETAQKSVSGARMAGPTAESEPVSALPPNEDTAAARLDAPQDGDSSAVMDIDVTADSVSVTPDTDLIEQTPADAFPLYIDPTVTWNESERTVLSSDGDVFYNFSDGTNGMSVGHCGTEVIGGVTYYCTSGTPYTNRMYFEFAPDKLKGKQVVDATFAVTETWSFSCDATWVDLERTNNISSSTKWPGPTKLDQMGDRNVSAGRGDNCSPSQPRKAIEFNDNADETDENLTPTVKDFAAGKISRLTLMLMAKDESDTNSWKRFNGDAVLSVDYIGKPALPGDIGLVAGTSFTCSTNAASPSTVSDPTPALTARPRTESGGSSEAKLRAIMDVEKKNSDGTWTGAVPDLTVPSTGYVGHNTKVTGSVAALQDGINYRYRAWTRSYNDSGSTYLSGPSNGSTTGWCYFKVDAAAPKAPSITFTETYSQCTVNSCVPGGGPGTEGAVTFGPTSGDVNVAYIYRLSTTNTWSPDQPGATVTVTFAPTLAGAMQLHVKAKDSQGRLGAENIVDFVVKEGSGPVARWHFDEDTGVAIDSSGGTTVHNATLTGGANRTDKGRRGQYTDGDGQEVLDKGLDLDGTTGYAATSGQVVDTRASYTVSAWVRLESMGRSRTVLGQNGVNRSPFYLSYENAVGTWSLRAVSSDAPASGTWTYQRVTATKPPVLGVWTHLAGVYNSVAKTITLYVNGVPQGTVPYTTAWAAAGPVQIGRVQWSETYTDYWDGQIDEAAVWQRALSNDEIRTEARLLDDGNKAYVELAASWNADAATGNALTDDSGYDRTLALSGGATLDGEAIALNGSTGSGTTTAPVVDDTGSFSATASVELDGKELAKKPNGYRAQVIGQRTATGSSWGVWFEKTGSKTVLDEDSGEERTVVAGVWYFGRLAADGTAAGPVVSSDETADADGSVQITGVYNAQDGTNGTISLYLSATPNGQPTAYTALAGTGEFAVGKGYTSSAWNHYLPGRIAEVRVWTGAFSDSDQVEQVVGS